MKNEKIIKKHNLKQNIKFSKFPHNILAVENDINTELENGVRLQPPSLSRHSGDTAISRPLDALPNIPPKAPGQNGPGVSGGPPGGAPPRFAPFMRQIITKI